MLEAGRGVITALSADAERLELQCAESGEAAKEFSSLIGYIRGGCNFTQTQMSGFPR